MGASASSPTRPWDFDLSVSPGLRDFIAVKCAPPGSAGTYLIRRSQAIQGDYVEPDADLDAEGSALSLPEIHLEDAPAGMVRLSSWLFTEQSGLTPLSTKTPSPGDMLTIPVVPAGDLLPTENSWVFIEVDSPSIYSLAEITARPGPLVANLLKPPAVTYTEDTGELTASVTEQDPYCTVPLPLVSVPRR